MLQNEELLSGYRAVLSRAKASAIAELRKGEVCLSADFQDDNDNEVADEELDVEVDKASSGDADEGVEYDGSDVEEQCLHNLTVYLHRIGCQNLTQRLFDCKSAVEDLAGLTESALSDTGLFTPAEIWQLFVAIRGA